MPQYLYVGNASYKHYSQSHPWFLELMENEWFRTLCKERWLEALELIKKTPDYVRRVGALYSDDFDKNFERWNIFGQKINRERALLGCLLIKDIRIKI